MNLTSSGSINDSTDDLTTDITGSILTLTAVDEIGGNVAGSTTDTLQALDINGTSANVSTTGTGGTHQIVLREADGIELTDIDTAEDPITIISTTGDITLGHVEAGTTTDDDVTITATAGSINDLTANADDNEDIDGVTVTLSAATGIGDTADVDITAVTMDLTNTGTGSIDVHELSGVTISGVTAAAGSIDLDIDGDTLLSGSITTSNDNNSSTGTNEPGVSASTGSITIDVTGTLSGTQTIQTGNARADAGTVDAVNATSGSVTITASTHVQDINIVTGTADVVNSDGIADVATVGSISVTATAGSIGQTTSDRVSVTTGEPTVDGVTGTEGSVTLSALAGSIWVDSASDVWLASATANALFDFDVTGAINDFTSGVDAVVDITAPTVVLNATAGIGSTNTLETTTADLTVHVTAAGDIVITETDGLLLNDIDTSNGDITLVSTTGNITIDDAGVVAGSSGDVTITATAGTINDAQANTNTTTDITGNLVTLTAATGIGETADVDTAATSLDASVTGTGVIVINEVDTVELSDVDTANGSITITSASAMTVTDVIAGGDTGSDDDVTLTTTSGNIIMSGDITALNDEVILVSAANVTDTTNGTTDISAANLDITASGTIGAAGTDNELDTDVDTLTIAAQGNTYVLEENDITLTSVVTTIGLIDIKAAGTMTLIAVTAAEAVDLFATAGNIVDNATGTTLVTAGAESSLRASGIIGTALGPYNPIDVDIDGDLWVWAGSRQNEISVLTQGRVVSTAKTERTEILLPSPPGLVLHDNHLIGGGNYGSSRDPDSILSRGYGEMQSVRNNIFNNYYIKSLQPWGYKVTLVGGICEVISIDEEFLNGPGAVIDGSEVGVKILPPELMIAPEKFQPKLYIIQTKI